MSGKAAMRLKKEYQMLVENPIPGSKVYLENDEDLRNWIVVIEGPVGTPYEGGLFKALFQFPENFPFKPPKPKFATTVYHPNVNLTTGQLCQATFEDAWTPTQKIADMIKKIIGLLEEPNTSTPVEPEICIEYINDRETFNEKAKEHTAKYAI